MSEWFAALDRFGVAVCVLIAAGLATWRIGRWMGPRVDKVVDSHVGFVSKVGDQVESGAVLVELTLNTNKDA